jgi:hypothetical protein
MSEGSKKRKYNGQYPPAGVTACIRIDTGRENIPRPANSTGQLLTGPYSPFDPDPMSVVRRDSLPPPSSVMVPIFTRGGQGLGHPTYGSQSSDVRIPMATPPIPAGRMSLSGPSSNETYPARSSSVGNVSPARGHAVPPTPGHPPGKDGHESLRLPPIQKIGFIDHGRSLESLILGMPFAAKIKILRRVVLPVKNHAVHSGSVSRPRGAIISVEGDKDAPIETVLVRLEDTLKKQGDFKVITLSGPKLPGPDASIGKYVEEVAKWHQNAAAIVDMVLGSQSLPEEQALHSQGTTSKERADLSEPAAPSIASDEKDRMDVDRSPMERDPAKIATSSRTSGTSTPKLVATMQPELSLQRQVPGRRSSAASYAGASTINTLFYSGASNHGEPPKIPLVLIPCYLFGASNAWAAALPLNDAYSPKDHWQWTATLWRGVPGPDFTIYVRSEEGERQQADNATGNEWPPTGSTNNVEIKEEYGLIVIRTTKEGNASVADGGAVRRIAFEVGEWARAVSVVNVK